MNSDHYNITDLAKTTIYSNEEISIDGESLDLLKIFKIAHGANVTLLSTSKTKIEESRNIVKKIVKKGIAAYGITTGFGHFVHTRIEDKKLRQLQKNILLSHAGGSGSPLSAPETRLALALRLNVFAKGLTGVRVSLCEFLSEMINRGVYPLVPEFGSVGASGDLIPLSHLALPIIGEGEVFYKGELMSAAQGLECAGMQPMELAEKEGLSLINGTQIMLSTGSLALIEALKSLKIAEKVAALSLEGMEGVIKAYYPLLHKARNQTGQIITAQNILKELKGSYLEDGKLSHSRVQDSYSLRCVPQVHGASRDALGYTRKVIERELNAATDNPLVFSDEEIVVSGGNFHGQPLALAYDFASIACSELGNISERRLELMSNPHMSNLPAFLINEGGINSGYMVLQYLAASLVNECKLNANPTSTDSIPGNVGVEDHVSMGMTSARKFKRIIKALKRIFACEAVAACQAIDLRKVTKLGEGTQKLYEAIRSKVPYLESDRFVSLDVRCVEPIIEELISAEEAL